MRKNLLIFLVILAGSTFSQSTDQIFNSKAMTFYGLDFTATKCIGSSEFPGGKEMVNSYFQRWNDVFMKGEKPLKIGAPYKKKQVTYDTAVFEYNQNIEPAELIIDQPYILKKSKVRALVEKYADNTKSGIGLVYMVEALNAKEEYLSVWITFFDIETGEVILSEPTRNVGKGKDFYEYWKLALLRLYTSSGDDYKNWKKIYN